MISSRSAILVAGLLVAGRGFAGNAPVDEIFVPLGFDDNDQVEVILHGDFDNSCARITNTHVAVDQATKRITVSADYRQYDPASQSQLCLQVVLPFIEVVKLGELPAGHYTVELATDAAVTAELEVARAKTESPDDYLYAPIENAWVDADVVSGKQSLVIQGSYPHWFVGCQRMKEVQVDKQGDILVVLPISEVVEEEFCQAPDYDFNFKIRQPLPAPMTKEGLLHVRTMHSNSVNRYVPAP